VASPPNHGNGLFRVGDESSHHLLDQRQIVGVGVLGAQTADQVLRLVALDRRDGRAQVQDLIVRVDEGDAVGAVLAERPEPPLTVAQ
jgi:hypothetical protein